MEEIKTKVCRKCNCELPVTAFSKHKKASDGLQPYCKECAKKSSYESYHRRKTSALTETTAIVAENGQRLVKVYAHPELAKFTPRQLMEELKARGFRWEYMLEPQRKIMFDKI